MKKHKRLKYACRCCGDTVLLAPSPFEAIEKGLAGPNLLAQVLVDKYGDHLPLYRQEKRFERHDIQISRSTLWNWIRLSALSLQPLVAAMKQDMFIVDHLFSDDTTMPTLRNKTLENQGKPAKRNYMWTYCGFAAGKLTHTSNPIVVYDFAEGRGSKYPLEFLKDFKGYLQADAYAGYNPLFTGRDGKDPRCIPAGCWAHVRRRFENAVDADKNSIATEMLEMIGKLYHWEREFRAQELNPTEIKLKRQELVKPQLDKIHAWLIKYEPLVLPKSLLGQAIFYALLNWQALMTYTQDGRLEIDNNRAERSIKSIVIGRKNYLFMGSNRGGEAAAIIYSLIETCKLNGVDPVAYLADVLARIPTHPNSKIHELLPYHWQPPNLREQQAS